MKAILFSTSGVLSEFAVRMNVQRIPEVRIRLKEAQTYLDTSTFSGVDVFGALSSEDRIFQRDAEFQRLLEGIIQFGLYERFVKRGGVGDFFIGTSHSDGVLSLISGQRTVADHVAQSQWAQKQAQPSAVAPVTLNLPGVPLLARGVAQTPLKVIQVKLTEVGQEVRVVGEESFDVETILQNLVDEEKVERLITVGPRNQFRERIENSIVRERVDVLDVIDSDPFLGWFERDCISLAAI